MSEKLKNSLVAEGHLRSFGRTSSRMSVGEQEALEARLAPFSVATENPIQLENLFGKAPSHLVVELGMGNGESIGLRAERESEKTFIGCEVYKNGLLQLLKTLEEKQLANLKICNEDARDLLTALPENSVDELVILYPDPWPKNKQKKRRLINANLLNLANKVLKDEGVLFIATDIPDYMMWILREIYTEGTFFPTAISPEEWASAPSWWHSTKYEQKAFAKGRKAWYMTFKRNVDKSNTKCDRNPTLKPTKKDE